MKNLIDKIIKFIDTENSTFFTGLFILFLIYDIFTGSLMDILIGAVILVVWVWFTWDDIKRT